MSSGRFWMLGAEDPEMQAIERLLRECGETVGYATVGGKRVHPGNAYQSEGVEGFAEWPTHFIECELVNTSPYWDLVNTGALPQPASFDHHRPGDYGFGRGPAQFLSASSVGQVVAFLCSASALPWQYLKSASRPQGFHLADEWIVSNGSAVALVPAGLLMTAAADHCLAAALQGKCPGVDANDFADWRAATCGYADILPEVSAWLAGAPTVSIGGADVADLRGRVLTLAALRCMADLACSRGVAYLATPPAREGERPKVVLGGCGEGTVPGVEPVKAFLSEWATAQGLVEPYGDPVRGFAGSYLAQ